MENKLLKGDNIELLKSLEDNSVDSIVTDPPYGLSFMNKKWDYDVPSVEFWKEVYRVLKPGGHVLSFGGTRTYHRMVVNIEDAGFEIRDQIQWLYGSGFPKSHNIGKAVDKKGLDSGPYKNQGTALKPANEPIALARKPFKGTVVDNVLKWGTGGINIDGCRVGETGARNNGSSKGTIDSNSIGYYKPTEPIDYNMGRFPANIILECICDEVIKGEKGEVKKGFPGGSTFGGSEMSDKVEWIWYNDKGDIHTNPNCPCYILDEQGGERKVGKGKRSGGFQQGYIDGDVKNRVVNEGYNDKGGASRFFYQAKVSKKERNMGLDHFEERKASKLNNRKEGSAGLERREGESGTNPYLSISSNRKNTHPTVKPVSLMAYLVRLITPPNGIVLDPFMGSGSTGIASNLEGFNFIGMEMDEDYFKIAETRINNYEEYRQFLKIKKNYVKKEINR